MRLQCASQFLAFGLRHRDVVFDIHGVEHLATEAFAHQAGTNAFTGGVNRRRRARRAGADNQNIIRITFVQRFCRTFFGTRVHFGNDFGQRHTALAKLLTVHKDRRNAHDVTVGDFVLERTAVNRRVLNARVQHRHQVQRLHHVRAVMAGE